MKARSWLPLKLRLLAGRKGRGKRSLSAIARKYIGVDNENNSASTPEIISLGVDIKNKYKSTPTLQRNLSEVLHGKRNTPHLVRLLETEWGMTIGEIRAVLQEDKERALGGNPVTFDEAKMWIDDRRKKKAIENFDPEALKNFQNAFSRLTAA